MQFASIVLRTFEALRRLLQAMHQHVSAGTFFPADLQERHAAFLFTAK
jgi:hypothetical protein